MNEDLKLLTLWIEKNLSLPREEALDVAVKLQESFEITPRILINEPDALHPNEDTLSLLEELFPEDAY